MKKCNGFEAVRSIISGAYNGQVGYYPIQSGYEYNLFNGDVVMLSHDGYVVSPRSLALKEDSTEYQTYPMLGIFNGCSYASNNTQQIDFANPAQTMWRGGTQTYDGQPAMAQIIDDPNIVFNVLAGSDIPLGTKIGMATVPVVYFDSENTSMIYSKQVMGDYATGQSWMGISAAHVSTEGSYSNYTFRIIRRLMPSETGGVQSLRAFQVIPNNHIYKAPALNDSATDSHLYTGVLNQNQMIVGNAQKQPVVLTMSDGQILTAKDGKIIAVDAPNKLTVGDDGQLMFDIDVLAMARGQMIIGDNQGNANLTTKGRAKTIQMVNENTSGVLGSRGGQALDIVNYATAEIQQVLTAEGAAGLVWVKK